MKRKKIKRADQKKCFFCQNNQIPNYKEVEILTKFLNKRQKIVSREYTGTCAKHQRKLAKAIKQARHLALLTFVNQLN